jgi:rod shape determining protein RodA
MAGPVAEVAGVRREAVRRGAGGDEHGLVYTLVTQLDWLLLAGIVALVVVGLWAVGGITRYDAGVGTNGAPLQPSYFLMRQEMFVAVGVVGFVAALLVPPSLLLRFWRVVYGCTLAGLLLVIALGEATRGAKRWITFGSFQFQPSEFGKVLMVLALAGLLAERGRRIREPRTALVAVGLAAPAILLVFVQPDLGTALVYAAVLAAVLFFAGTPWVQLAIGGGGVVIVAALVLWGLPSFGLDVLKPYQKDRLVGFTHASTDPNGPNYNVNQSKTALASGGVNGLGYGKATQTKYNFLPAHRTDFAFSAFAEQHGFVGAAALLLLWLFVLWRGLRVVTLATDAFSAIVAGGIVSMLVFQIAVNVGMTMQMAPVTGIPLPLVSYGGSATIATLVALGVLVGIQVRAGRRRTA